MSSISVSEVVGAQAQLSPEIRRQLELNGIKAAGLILSDLAGAGILIKARDSGNGM